MVFSDQYRNTKGMLNRASQLLVDLEIGRGDPDELQGRISKSCSDLQTALGELADMVADERSGRRAVMQQQLRLLEDEHQDVQMGLKKYITGAQKRRMAQKNRQALYTGMDAPENLAGTEMLEKEGQSIDKTTNAMQSLVEESQAVLSALRTQTSAFQRMSKRLTTVVESSSLSRSILQTISRTERTDALIVYVGMFVITFVMLLIWWYR